MHPSLTNLLFTGFMTNDYATKPEMINPPKPESTKLAE